MPRCSSCFDAVGPSSGLSRSCERNRYVLSTCRQMHVSRIWLRMHTTNVPTGLSEGFNSADGGTHLQHVLCPC